MKYKVYNKIYEDGKPTGHTFLNVHREFSSAATAKRANDRVNASWNKWNKKQKEGSNLTTKTVKVVAVRKKIVRRANVGARSGLKFLGLR